MSSTMIKVEGVSKKFCRSLKRSLWYGMQDLGSELLGKRHSNNEELRFNEFSDCYQSAANGSTSSP